MAATREMERAGAYAADADEGFVEDSEAVAKEEKLAVVEAATPVAHWAMATAMEREEGTLVAKFEAKEK